MTLQVTHNNDFTALQREVIDAWFAGYTTDKEQARYLGISVAALRSRLGALYYRAGVPFGARRDQAMLHIWQHGLVEVHRAARAAAVAALCIFASGTLPGDDGLRIQRARRTASAQQQGRRRPDPITLTDELWADYLAQEAA